MLLFVSDSLPRKTATQRHQIVPIKLSFNAFHSADAWSIYYVARVFSIYKQIFFFTSLPSPLSRLFFFFFSFGVESECVRGFERDTIEINHSYNCWHYTDCRIPNDRRIYSVSTKIKIQIFFLSHCRYGKFIKCCPLCVNWFDANRKMIKYIWFSAVFRIHHLSQSVSDTIAPRRSIQIIPIELVANYNNIISLISLCVTFDFIMWLNGAEYYTVVYTHTHARTEACAFIYK